MFENPRRSRQARNFTTNVPKILDLKSSSEQIFFRKLSLGAPDYNLPLSLLCYNIGNSTISVRALRVITGWHNECFLRRSKYCLNIHVNISAHLGIFLPSNFNQYYFRRLVSVYFSPSPPDLAIVSEPKCQGFIQLILITLYKIVVLHKTIIIFWRKILAKT